VMFKETVTVYCETIRSIGEYIQTPLRGWNPVSMEAGDGNARVFVPKIAFCPGGLFVLCVLKSDSLASHRNSPQGLVFVVCLLPFILSLSFFPFRCVRNFLGVAVKFALLFVCVHWTRGPLSRSVWNPISENFTSIFWDSSLFLDWVCLMMTVHEDLCVFLHVFL
jgi:hypothetical protein